MPDSIRTALKGGGSLDLRIRLEASGDLKISAHEDYARLDAWRHKTITAAELEAMEDPDATIRETAITMINENHVSFEGRKAAGVGY